MRHLFDPDRVETLARSRLEADTIHDTLLAMSSSNSRDPLHGVTLERLLTELVAVYDWPELGRRVPVRCFLHDPSIKSSLTFLRKTPWARAKVEDLYVRWKLTGS